MNNVFVYKHTDRGYGYRHKTMKYMSEQYMQEWQKHLQQQKSLIQSFKVSQINRNKMQTWDLEKPLVFRMRKYFSKYPLILWNLEQWLYSYDHHQSAWWHAASPHCINDYFNQLWLKFYFFFIVYITHVFLLILANYQIGRHQLSM